MATKNPRINVVLDGPVYGAVKRISGKYKISMSMVIRDMVKEELERFEDDYLSGVAAKRDKTLKKGRVKSHRDVWK